MTGAQVANALPDISKQDRYHIPSNDMVAWLITWEWDNPQNEVENRIVSILNYRRSPPQIRKYLEFLWVHHSRSLYGVASWAAHRSSPPAIRGDIVEEKFEGPYGTIESRTEQSSWDLEIGTDPYLRARVVDDLRVDIQEIGETIFWRERQPSRKWNERPKADTDAKLKSYTRKSRGPLHTAR